MTNQDSSKKSIVECIVNYSEGRRKDVIDCIVEPYNKTKGIKCLNVEADHDYNRVVVTIIGDPEVIVDAIIASAKIAIEHIDLNNHTGQHARMGAIDVIPFVPIQNSTMEQCIKLAHQTAVGLAQLGIPVYLYEEAATTSQRENLADIRKGEFEGLKQKMMSPQWMPDYGPQKPHPSAGATAVGARKPLIAFNIDLDTDDVEIAKKIAQCIRYSSGGFRYIKAGGVEVKARNITQVTMNITDYTKTSIYRVFETVKMEARRYGVQVVGSEIVGLVPMAALTQSAAYYLQLRNYSEDKILETRLEDL